MIGIRQLRADLAAHVRRAAGGETTVISIGGSPAAALTPLALIPPTQRDEPPGDAHLSSLVASGALIAATAFRRAHGGRNRFDMGQRSPRPAAAGDPRMTVYLDTSALVGLHIDGPARAVVLGALERDPDWCSSGLTLMESLALVDRVTEEPVLRSDLENLVRLSSGSRRRGARRPAMPRSGGGFDARTATAAGRCHPPRSS